MDKRSLVPGMVEWADYTQDSRYYDFLMQIGKKHHWGFLKRLYHADDLVIAQMYIRMYEKYHDPAMIQPTIARVDSVVAKPSEGPFVARSKELVGTLVMV